MTHSIGIPVTLLHNAVGTVVTAELSSGETFRGTLKSVEDNMNMELEDATHTDRRGRTRDVPTAYLRGSTVTFFVLPDSLELAPCAAADKGKSVSKAAAGRNGKGDRQKRDRDE